MSGLGKDVKLISSLTAPGIVSLLFCGITLKHYAYYNMSRRTQLTTKYLFQVMAQLSENFIFIYLGLDLLVERDLKFKPLFVIVTVIGICVARYLSVFPLSKAVNWFIRYRARRKGIDVADELPFSYQAMLFWAGLRGAVGVALAAGMNGANAPALRATVLVVVVLTVIIFGGTTARMLDILGIRTGVVEEVESDDEFDIEVTHSGTYYKRPNSTGIGYTPRRNDLTIPLDDVANDVQRPGVPTTDGYSSGNNRKPSPPSRPRSAARKAAVYSPKDLDSRRDLLSTQGLLGVGSVGRDESDIGSDDDIAGVGRHRAGKSVANGDVTDQLEDFEIDVDPISDDDLPPPAPSTSRMRRSPSQPQHLSPVAAGSASVSPARRAAESGTAPREPRTARTTLRDLFSGGPTGDHGEWFRQLDEDFIKPTLLLDQSNHKGPGAV